jgi:hypothetical protein
MPSPLTIKRLNPAPAAIQLLMAAIFFVPLLGLLYLWNQGKVIHFELPANNLIAHALIVIMPVIWAIVLWLEPFQTTASDDTQLGETTYFGTLKVDWWMSLMLWSCPVFALGALGYRFATSYLPHPERLSTSPLVALGTMVFIFAIAALYATTLFNHAQIRISNEGLRNGLLNFYEWENIHHISQRDDIYSIYHRTNPRLPATCFNLRSLETRELLCRHLAEFNIPLEPHPHAEARGVKAAVIAGFILNLIVSALVLRITRFDLRWMTAISLGFAIISTLVLERIRGVRNYTKLKPKIEPTPAQPES